MRTDKKERLFKSSTGREVALSLVQFGIVQLGAVQCMQCSVIQFSLVRAVIDVCAIQYLTYGDRFLCRCIQ